MVNQMVSQQGIPGATELPPAAAPASGGAPAPGGGPEASPAELEAVLQQQQGMSPEAKRQAALQKLLRLRAAIDQLIRILQGQQAGQPPGWMTGGGTQQRVEPTGGAPRMPQWAASPEAGVSPTGVM